MRLIDIEAINWYDDLFMKGVNHNGVWVRYRDVEHLIRNAPTVDAVPVVRCRDCKWWKTNYFWNGTERKVCVIEPYEPVRKPEDYCSRGERKEDENAVD